MHPFPQSKIKEIARRYKLELLVLFGSRAAGTATASSDFDVAYMSREPLTLEQEARLITDLMPLCRSDRVDLVSLRRAPPLLAFAICQNAQVIYEANQLIFPTVCAYAFKRYVEEAKPILKLQERALHKFA